MSSTVVIIGGAAIVIYTIGSQIMGTALRAKRLVIIPAALMVIGIVDLAGHSVHPDGTDIALIAIGSAVAAAIGLTLGVMMDVRERDGYLWGKSPLKTLWLWAAFFVSRGVLIGIGHAAHAHVASSTHAELLVLGINRVAQALVIGLRGVSMGVPFAPESNGSQPLGGLFGRIGSATGSPTAPVARPRADGSSPSSDDAWSAPVAPQQQPSGPQQGPYGPPQQGPNGPGRQPPPYGSPEQQPYGPTQPPSFGLGLGLGLGGGRRQARRARRGRGRF